MNSHNRTFCSDGEGMRRTVGKLNLMIKFQVIVDTIGAHAAGGAAFDPAENAVGACFVLFGLKAVCQRMGQIDEKAVLAIWKMILLDTAFLFKCHSGTDAISKGNRIITRTTAFGLF